MVLRSLCALLDIICMDALHSATPIGVWEVRILGFDHTPRYHLCEEFLVVRHRGAELSDGKKRDGVSSYPFPIGELEESSLHLTSGS